MCRELPLEITEFTHLSPISDPLVWSPGVTLSSERENKRKGKCEVNVRVNGKNQGRLGEDRPGAKFLGTS